MPSLPDELFGLVEKAVLDARQAAEESARAAINTLAVNRAQPFNSLGPEERRLRNALRARARQLGDGSQHRGLPLLIEEIAYQQWHRMLFARFLAENGLLMHPTGIPVTLRDCAELAPEEGEPDAWALAARYASAMLPGIFCEADPVAQVRFAPEGRLKLEGILNDLPPLVFAADDALGWMYQFWQTQKKDAVNASERKIGWADIAPVTQLFTENYIVRFLLENSLGAWWAAQHPDSPLVKGFDYLRFREDGTPAAGTFPGWPDHAAEITIMDPCCGSGHFLVVAFEMLCCMRMEEEGLEKAAAANAVLRDNLFGLELDPRCTQIAAFVLALAAWKAGGYRPLPIPNIACSGIPVLGQLQTWTKLAGDDQKLRATLEQLYHLFQNAPDRGSLINPIDVASHDQMFSPSYAQVEPLLEKALARENGSDDPVGNVFGVAIEGVVHATKLLTGRYTLVTTNVPYLARGKQDELLMEFCEKHHPQAKQDLATAFVERCEAFCSPAGTAAIVTPQNWLFLKTYSDMRVFQLSNLAWNVVAYLGSRAFGTISGEVVNVALLVLTYVPPNKNQMIMGLDASDASGPTEKARLLRELPLLFDSQSRQLKNPDARIALGYRAEGPLLEDYATSLQGIATGDYARYGRYFWELSALGSDWEFQQSTVRSTTSYGGREHVVFWEDGKGEIANSPKARVQGLAAVGKRGVAVSQMQDLPVTLYTGELFDNNVAIVLPDNSEYLAAIWAFCSSTEFSESVRLIDRKMSVTNATLAKVPFDLEYWREVADAVGPLPVPHSNDPTQWLFEGHPVSATEPLQVAVVRLLGYRWPEQKADELDDYADEDGIVCLVPVAREMPAGERLRALLAAAYGVEWSPVCQEELLAAAGFSGKDLDDWLCDGFFIQHCQLFHNRPFIWHIWDGRRDGFSALVNYHKLNAANLNKLIYTYLGDWIRVQRSRRDAGESGAEGRLVAALELQKKLEAIRDGESPYDIYVRWKPLHEQPTGWNPDLNDGVRLNIRPFVKAGVLRRKFTIHWRKDRGKNPDDSERLNDIHLTLAEKRAAREKHKAAQTGKPAKKGKGRSRDG